jgi:hypothetical protein
MYIYDVTAATGCIYFSCIMVSPTTKVNLMQNISYNKPISFLAFLAFSIFSIDFNLYISTC